jgi:hypothetical protein
MTIRRWLTGFFLALVLCACTIALAHPGGRDAYGGHNDRKSGGYHFHAGPLAGQSFGSKNEALAALRAREQGTSAAAAASPPQAAAVPQGTSGSGCDCEALARLLAAKGLITAAELATVTTVR